MPMPMNKTLALLFGTALGMAGTAIVIGLLLVATALVLTLTPGAATGLLQHPLYAAGSELARSGLLAGLPLVALGYFWRRP